MFCSVQLGHGLGWWALCSSVMWGHLAVWWHASQSGYFSGSPKFVGVDWPRSDEESLCFFTKAIISKRVGTQRLPSTQSRGEIKALDLQLISY